MKITFNKLRIENFKGIESLEFEFAENNQIIGANETGKSTVADAISYCLTGKSSDGSSNFGIIPVGKDGVSPTVTLDVCMEDGKETRYATLKRVNQAKYNRAKEFTGDYNTVCYINDVKTSVSEFNEWIDSHICPKEIFNLLFDSRYFTENMPVSGRERPWEVQRRLLMTICPLKTDAQLAAKSKRWESLVPLLSRYDNISQLLTALKTRLATVTKETESFPIEIDALERSKSDVDVEQIKQQIQDIRTKMAEVAAEKDNIIAENNNRTAKYASKVKDTQDKLFENKTKLIKRREELADIKRKVSDIQAKMQQCKDNAAGIKETKIEDVCHTCGQPIQPDKVASQKEKITANIARLRREYTAWEKALEPLKEQAEAVNLTMDSIESNIAKWQKEIDKVKAPEAEPTIQFDIEIGQLGSKLADALKALGSAERNDEIEQTIVERETKHRADMELKAQLMQQIDLCTQFISHKCKTAEKQVNDLFDGVTFRMFRQNKTNDEIRECCDIYWNDVAYSDLSYSTKFIVSLKIVQAFQRHYNVYVPILIDNAESIDMGNFKLNSQTISLVKESENCPGCGGETGRREPDGYWTCAKCGSRFKKKLQIVSLY